MDEDDDITEIRIGTVPGPRTATSGELPLEPGRVQMAFPPPGGELVQAVTENGEITGYYSIRVEQCEPMAAGDFWSSPDDEIPGEFQCEMRIGDDFSTRDMVGLHAELRERSPAQYARLAMEFASAAQAAHDQEADPAILN